MRSSFLRGALLAAAALSLGALGCTDPLSNCGYIGVVPTALDSLGEPVVLDSLGVVAGDSVILTAQTASSCPDQIGPAVDFTSGDTTIATVRATGDITAWVKGIAPGVGSIVATSHDRTSIRTGIPVFVTAPNGS